MGRKWKDHVVCQLGPGPTQSAGFHPAWLGDL